jgi:hypothetical protein
VAWGLCRATTINDFFDYFFLKFKGFNNLLTEVLVLVSFALSAAFHVSFAKRIVRRFYLARWRAIAGEMASF